MTLKSLFLIIISGSFFLFVLYPNTGSAQMMENEPRWFIGGSGGVLTGTIPSGSTATNVISGRFSVGEDYYPSLSIHAGYLVTPFESVELNFTSGSFSVFTDYDFWPDLLFDNQFYAATLTTKLRLRRIFESIPQSLDFYGAFGLGFMQSNHTITPNSLTDTAQIELEVDTSQQTSLLATFGAGVDLSLSDKFILFLQYDYSIINGDLIDKKLAGEILRNDFITTTNNWSSFSAGFRIRFGRSFTPSRPSDRDFEITDALPAQTVQESDDEDVTEETTLTETETQTETEPVVLTQPVTEEIIEQATEDTTARPSEEIDEDPGTEVEETVSDSTADLPDEDIAEAVPSEEEIFDPEVSEEEIISDPDSVISETLEQTTSEPEFGLFGDVLTDLASGYTIIVHSFTQLELAESIINEFRNDGIRAFIQSTIVNQIRYYRVAIGQFETQNEARRAISSLPESYQRNHFISAIQ